MSKLTARYRGTISLCFVKSSCDAVSDVLYYWSRNKMTHPEGREGIRSDLKGTLVNPVKEPPEDAIARLWPVLVNTHQTPRARALLFTVIVEDDCRRRFMLQDLAQN